MVKKTNSSPGKKLSTDKIRQLNVFLLKDTVKLPTDIIKEKYTLSTKKLSQKSPLKGTFYWYQAGGRAPDWLTTVGRIDPNLAELGVFNSHAGGVLVTQAADRFFVLCFGYGRHLLKDGIVEPNFGLKVTLNSVSSEKLKAIDSSTLESQVIQTRRQASELSSVESFGIDVERDLCRAVTGVPDDTGFARQLSGADSLVAHVDLEKDEVLPFLRESYKRYKSSNYRKKFSWVDNVQSISDRSKIDLLNHALLSSLNSENFEKVAVSPPGIIDYTKVSGFSFDENGSPEIELTFQDFINSRSRLNSFSVNSLKRARMYVHDQQTSKIIDSFSVYSSLVWEYKLGEEYFLLFSGDWYCVKESFYKQITRTVSRIHIESLPFPDAKAGEKEGTYLRRVCQGGGGLFLYDQVRLVPTGSPTQVEFCDVFSAKKQLIHAKRGKRSSSLSHLFAQGLVSARIFIADNGYRKKIVAHNNKVSKYVPISKVDATKYSVVYAIITSDVRPFEISLPFFSQVNLAHTLRSLKAMNVTVKLARVNVL